MGINTLTATVDHIKEIAPEVIHFALKPAKPFEFVAGQFFRIHFENDRTPFLRSYSIATIPGSTDLIEFAVAYVKDGPGSEYLFHLKPGDQVNISGPFGKLVLPDEKPKRYVLIATGTGVTPYRAMLPELVKRINNDKLEVLILLGARTRAHALYQDDFLKVAKQYPQCQFHTFYSRTFPDDAQAYEHKDYVQRGLDEFNLHPDKDIVFLCGNPNMIDEAFELLKAKGFDNHHVKREKYVSPKIKS